MECSYCKGIGEGSEPIFHGHEHVGDIEVICPCCKGTGEESRKATTV